MASEYQRLPKTERNLADVDHKATWQVRPVLPVGGHEGLNLSWFFFMFGGMIPEGQSFNRWLYMRPLRLLSLFFAGCSFSHVAPSLWAAAHSFEDNVGEVVQRYCLECHSSEKQKGDIDLEVMLTPGQFARFFKEWELVVEQLDAGDMPPAKADQPTTKDRSLITQSVHHEIERQSTQQSGDPGNMLLRRLTQAEYLNSIEDLTGLPFEFRSLLPGDAVGGEGFANTGEVQFTQDSTIERYLEVALKVVES